MTFRIISLLTILILNLSTYAQLPRQRQEVIFKRIGEDKDYPYEDTPDIMVDSDGFLWITWRGLSRWDGSRFLSYEKIPFDTLGLTSRGINKIVEDKEGNFWIGKVYGGLEKYTKEDETFHQIEGSAEINGIYCLKFDDEGILWIGATNGLFSYHPDEGEIKSYRDPDPAYHDYGQGIDIYALEFDTTGVMWIASGSGLYYYDREKHVIHHLPLKVPAAYPDDRVESFWDMTMDDHGMIWMLIGHRGLARFNPYSRELELIWPKQYEHPQNSIVPGAVHVNREGMVWFGRLDTLFKYDPFRMRIEDAISFPGYISAIIEDLEGNLIVGGQTGAWILDKQRSSLIQNSNQSFGFDGDVVTDILNDDRTVWALTKVSGIARYDMDTDELHRYFKDNQSGENANRFNRIIKDRSGRIWMMSLDHLYLYNATKDEFDNCPVPAGFMTLDREGIIWIACEDRLIRLDPESLDTLYIPLRDSIYTDLPLGYNDFYGFIRDTTGYLWLGHVRSGLFRIDPVSGNVKEYWNIKEYLNDPKKNYKNPVVGVNTILYDSKCRMWIGTYYGVIRVIQVPGTDSLSYEHVLQKDGSYLGMIYKITEDVFGNIWVGTSKAVFVIKPDGKVWKFDDRDGFTESHYHQFYVVKGNSDGTVYAAGRNVFEILPEFLKENTTVPPVFITEFRIHQEAVKPGKDSPLRKSILYTDRIVLDHDQNFIGFHFSALSFTHSYRNEYRYILEGVDPDTVNTRTRNFADYNDLRPGRYTFWVTGSNDTGLWNPEGRAIEIVIRPPWYRSLLAQTLYILLLFCLIYLFVRYRTRRLRMEKIILQREVESRTAELQDKNRQIVEMEQMKTRFFTNISHEIRTPLSLIVGPLDYLLKDPPKEKKKIEWLQLIKRNSQRLLQLVNQLLDISRIESGRMKLKLEHSDVIRNLHILAIEYDSHAESREVNYITDIPEQELNVWHDRDKILKVATNLLSNAFKFTPEKGTVTLRIKIIRSEGGNDSPQLRLMVADTGPGIPLEEKDKIFERFYRVEGNLFDEAGGTGIGLSLSKELVSLMHGSIMVKSLEGVGSVFIVDIPLGRDLLQETEYTLTEVGG